MFAAPGLATTTRPAVRVLARSKKGSFLMVAHNERPVSPASMQPRPGTIAHLDAAAKTLAQAIRAFAVADTTPEITTGQRFLGGQANALTMLVSHLVDIQAELDDVFPGDAKTEMQRRRDVVLAQLTTIWLPELADTSADAAREAGKSPQDIKDAVFDDVDLAFDWAVQQADRAAKAVTRAD